MPTATKKATAKPAAKPEPAKPKVDVRAQCAAWADAQRHIDVIDAQTGPDAVLSAGDVERLQADRAGHVAAQEAAEKALAG